MLVLCQKQLGGTEMQDLLSQQPIVPFIQQADYELIFAISGLMTRLIRAGKIT